MPLYGNREISDVFFIDSMTGWACTPYKVPNDSVFIFKTTNGGNNWFTLVANYANQGGVGLNKIQFLNHTTGYACGSGIIDTGKKFIKTTNGGFNWFSVNTPDPFIVIDDMYIFNIDTIWLASAGGGLFRTTNGGTTWTQHAFGSSNTDKIYFYNNILGFSRRGAGAHTYKTTNGGINWYLVQANQPFMDIELLDSLHGYKAFDQMLYTTNAGETWIPQAMPVGNFQGPRGIYDISIIDEDTIWTDGDPYILSFANFRGTIYKTTNGGLNWGYQLPDTNIRIFRYYHTQFTDPNTGWAYGKLSNGGVHTTTGGDSVTWYTWVGMNNNSEQLPEGFKLYQNYPNPFNPETTIKFKISEYSPVKLFVYDITGRVVKVLLSEYKQPGEYSIKFNAEDLPSGIYFYRLQIELNNNKYIQTKKAILIK
jgi:photosystem II stability/assembly factor-like uncharacterized protein